MPSMPADSTASPARTVEVIGTLFRRSPPRPSPRTTPSSPVRTIRAPAAAEESVRSCARESECPTETMRPTRPSATASGEPETAPSLAPTAMSALWSPARRSSRTTGAVATTFGSAAAADAVSWLSRSVCAALARSSKVSFSRSASAFRRRTFSSVAWKKPTVASKAPVTARETDATARAAGAIAVRSQDWSTVPDRLRAGTWAERSSTQQTRTESSTAPPRRDRVPAISTAGLVNLIGRWVLRGRRRGPVFPPGARRPAARLLRDRNLPQEIHVRQHRPGAEHDRSERIFRVRNGKTGFFSKAPVQVAQQRASSRDDDALVHDVGRELRRRALEGHADALDDCGHDLRKRVSHFLVGQDEGLRDPLDEIPPLDLHRHRLVERMSGADFHLHLLGGPLPDEQVVLAFDVLNDRLVHLVRGDPDRSAVNDAGERDDRDVGRASADVHDHVAGRLRDRKPGSDRRRHRLLDDEDLGRPRAQGGVLHRPLLD